RVAAGVHALRRVVIRDEGHREVVALFGGRRDLLLQREERRVGAGEGRIGVAGDAFRVDGRADAVAFAGEADAVVAVASLAVHPIVVAAGEEIVVDEAIALRGRHAELDRRGRRVEPGAHATAIVTLPRL